ncbi:CLUMA_CG018106, isoform A [Clunio marinus]|uniref:CLUMA_CG018106, isoform A n=1 Tax=Clunio marinus TaxID=568069 RepID=A0A1J1IYQ0_9DIPT|nr:CLUMA_CG018106, isoform A [Clunio marinus]
MKIELSSQSNEKIRVQHKILHSVELNKSIGIIFSTSTIREKSKIERKVQLNTSLHFSLLEFFSSSNNKV